MPVDQALRLASILLAAAAFVGLALGRHLPDWLTVLAGAALVYRSLRVVGAPLLGRLRAIIPVSTTTWNILLILGFLGFWADLVWISGELLPAGIHFLLVVMVIKLFNLQSRRDYSQLYAISLIAIVASAAQTAELWYVGIFLVYLLAGVWLLLLDQIAKESDDGASSSERPPPAAVPLPAGRITRPIFWIANGLVLGTFCVTLAIFFAIPRTSAGLLQTGFGEGLRTSGFSETVDLGSIGPIKRDPSVVMRVELPDRPPHEYDRLYLRGVAYDRYDGRSWINRQTHRRVLNESSPGVFQRRPFPPRPDVTPASELRQKILLEALDTTVLFAAPFAESVSGPFPTVQYDSTGALYLPFPSSTRIEYVAQSRPNPARETTRVARLDISSDTAMNPFLQLPFGSERVAALARTVAQGRATVYERARAIETHLSGQYRYSLDIPPGQPARPLEEFLFSRKSGYCEHYATAMVVMLRAIGIPARLVTGFLASEWNEYGNYYVVRQRDAHAWVEVYLPSSGWVTMDPTPSVGEEAADSGWTVVGRMMDTLRLRWNRVFVQYNAADQLALVQELKAGTASVRSQAWDSLRALVNASLNAVLNVARKNFWATLQSLPQVAWWGGVLLCGGLVAWLAWKRPWPRSRRSRVPSIADQRIVQLYQAMIGQAAKQGLFKQPATTPFEFLRTIRQEWTAAGTAAAVVTDSYCRARFGHATLSPSELARAEASLREVARLGRRAD